MIVPSMLKGESKMDINSKDLLKGLTNEEVEKLREIYGRNELMEEKKEGFIKKVFKVLSEPMFLLLIAAAVIYFILGEPKDAMVMLVFVLGIISIDIIQEWKTDKTLNALKDLSAPRIKVIRNGTEDNISSSDLVPGDIMIISEGVKIPADGEVIKANDLSVDESSLTGEAEPVWKFTINDKIENGDYWRKDYCYGGTLVTQGSGYILVDKTGVNTEYGKIGMNVAKAPIRLTPLQIQTGKLVKLCAGIAAILFVLVAVITYFNIPDHTFKERVIESILSGITLAMAMIPEEFPVILTVFLSMGAWRLAKKQSLVRKLPSVETLGSVSVLCVDKTGTITVNEMTVCETWPINNNTKELSEIMGLACETEAYDPMEKAMLQYCEEQGIFKEHLFGGSLIREYAFTNELKIMGHVWSHDGEIIVAVKGSPEKVLSISNINESERNLIEEKILEMSMKGIRVIGVGHAILKDESEIPDSITDCSIVFSGLIGLADPPRETVKEDIGNCIRAGIRVVMITGDNGITASSIARQIGMLNFDKIITGDQLNNMDDQELRTKVKDTSIFSRVIPEHKMRIVKALKDNGEIVAMTGDGVNDAPALKYADIGIAMGKRGSEVSREAADLILMDDNFSTIVDTIKDGRRIYDNIRKAVGYVFTIHIPIAFSALLAPFLNINPISLFLLPIHVVMLELIIDPTCSIVLERQPAEHNIMERPPRSLDSNILSKGVLFKSIIQGLVIFTASFLTYFIILKDTSDHGALARTMGLVIIMIANLFLVQVNSSNYEPAYKSLIRLAKDKIMWSVNLGTILGIILILYTPLSGFLKLAPLSLKEFALAFLIAAASVLWYEIVKVVKGVPKA